MAIPFAWLDALRRSLTAASGSTLRQKPLAIGIGYCPGCDGLRASSSPRCSHCGSTDPVTADA